MEGGSNPKAGLCEQEHPGLAVTTEEADPTQVKRFWIDTPPG
jgi:hypothetical protein